MGTQRLNQAADRVDGESDSRVSGSAQVAESDGLSGVAAALGSLAGRRRYSGACKSVPKHGIEFWGLGRELSGGGASYSQEVVIQRKLVVGEAGDKYEREAGRVAADVVARIHGDGGVGEPTEQRKGDKDRDELQVKPMAQGELGGVVSVALEGGIRQARRGGRAMEPHVLEAMEEALGADFSGVRIHTDVKADELSQALKARAFTTERDVFFRQGEYAPNHARGVGLLVHELVHVQQQEMTGKGGQASVIMRSRNKKDWRKGWAGAGKATIQKKTNVNLAYHHIISKETLANIGEYLTKALEQKDGENQKEKRERKQAAENLMAVIRGSMPGKVKQACKDENKEDEVVKILWNLGVNLELGPRDRGEDPGDRADANTQRTDSGERDYDPVSESLLEFENIWYGRDTTMTGVEKETWTRMTAALKAAIESDNRGTTRDIRPLREEQWVGNRQGTQWAKKGLSRWPGLRTLSSKAEEVRRMQVNLSEASAWKGTRTVVARWKTEAGHDYYREGLSCATIQLTINRKHMEHILTRHTYAHHKGQSKTTTTMWPVGTTAATFHKSLEKYETALLEDCKKRLALSGHIAKDKAGIPGWVEQYLESIQYHALPVCDDHLYVKMSVTVEAPPLDDEPQWDEIDGANEEVRYTFEIATIVPVGRTSESYTEEEIAKWAQTV